MMDLTVNWYMFPGALAHATLVNATGIEGTTLFDVLGETWKELNVDMLSPASLPMQKTLLLPKRLRVRN